MNNNIIVIDNYSEINICKEQYKIVFDYLFSIFFKKETRNIEFLPIKKIMKTSFEDTDIIILGGGEMLHNTFLDMINEKCKNNKIIAISINTPSLQLVMDSDKLKYIDYLFLRSDQNNYQINKYFNKERIIYLPDISYYLVKLTTNYNPDFYFKNTRNLLILQKNRCKKIISFSLHPRIYNESMLNEFIMLLTYLINNDYYIVFIPYSASSTENDYIKVHTTIYEKLMDRNITYIKNILNLHILFSPQEILLLYETMDINIVSQYHSCLFSLYKNIPFYALIYKNDSISLNTYPIKKLMLDLDYYYYYIFDKHSFRYMDIVDGINQIMKRYNTITSNMIKHCHSISCELNDKIGFFKSAIVTNIPKQNNVLYYCNRKIELLESKLNEFCKENNETDFRNITNKSLQIDVVTIISYYLTNGFYSKYNDELYSKLFRLRLHNSTRYGDEVGITKCKLFRLRLHNSTRYSDFVSITKCKLYESTIKYDWQKEYYEIIKDYESNYKSIKNNKTGLYCLSFANYYVSNENNKDNHDNTNDIHDDLKMNDCFNDLKMNHIHDDLKMNHSENSDLLLDLYIDKTFYSKYKVHKFVGIIPYKKKWIGFIHNHSILPELFKNVDFIESLEYCQGIFVFSQKIKKEIEKEIERGKENIVKVKIVCLQRPVKTKNRKCFNYHDFLENKNKKMICFQSSANIHSFYMMELDNEFTFYKKGYFFSSSFQDTLKKVIITEKKDNNDSTFINDSLSYEVQRNNVWNYEENRNNSPCINHDFQNYIKKKIDSVECIYIEKNQETDATNIILNDLLSNNIVIFNIDEMSIDFDILLECIMRNTPIIINKNDYVVELLGNDYPLYYEYSSPIKMNNDVMKLLSNTDSIRKAYKYLEKIKKDSFHVCSFVSDFIGYL